MDLTAVAIVLIAVGLPVIGITLIQLAKIITGGASRSQRNAGGDETALMQQIHSTLTRLEKRIDTLETIVLDRNQK